MKEKYLLLERSIQRDLQSIEQIFASIDTWHVDDETDQETLIVIGYRLHNLYNAFETIFQNIAEVFENSVDDTSRWHTQLLQRMRLDAMPLRPAVIDDASYEALDELRRFRHMFRHAYDVELEAQRLQLVLTKALQLRQFYRPQFEEFLEFLRSVREQ